MRQGGNVTCDNNGSEHRLHTKRATYGSVVIFTKTSIYCSFPPSLPASLPACRPAGRPTDPLTYLYLQYPPSQFHRDLSILYDCVISHKTSIHHSFPPSLPPSLPPSVPACLPACWLADRPTDTPTYLPIPTVPTY